MYTAAPYTLTHNQQGVSEIYDKSENKNEVQRRYMKKVKAKRNKKNVKAKHN
jgi:hypothetical protein